MATNWKINETIAKIVSENYGLNVVSIGVLAGGYNPDETYVIHTQDDSRYLVKFLIYSGSVQSLTWILSFQNYLKESHHYPCARIIPTKDQQIVIFVQDRLFFIQDFLNGLPATNEYLKENPSCFSRAGSLLAQWRFASRAYCRLFPSPVQFTEFTDQWWDNLRDKVNDPFLRMKLVQYQDELNDKFKSLEHGLIHNDFHLNNMLINADGSIDVIDLIDGCQSAFLADFATSIFHLLVHEQNNIERVKLFVDGYQQVISLPSNELDIIDLLVRIKLTASLIDDLHHSKHVLDPFLQSCYQTLNLLNYQSQFIKNLLEK